MLLYLMMIYKYGVIGMVDDEVVDVIDECFMNCFQFLIFCDDQICFCVFGFLNYIFIRIIGYFEKFVFYLKKNMFIDGMFLMIVINIYVL